MFIRPITYFQHFISIAVIILQTNILKPLDIQFENLNSISLLFASLYTIFIILITLISFNSDTFLVQCYRFRLHYVFFTMVCHKDIFHIVFSQAMLTKTILDNERSFHVFEGLWITTDLWIHHLHTIFIHVRCGSELSCWELLHCDVNCTKVN